MPAQAIRTLDQRYVRLLPQGSRPAMRHAVSWESVDGMPAIHVNSAGRIQGATMDKVSELRPIFYPRALAVVGAIVLTAGTVLADDYEQLKLVINIVQGSLMDKDTAQAGLPPKLVPGIMTVLR